MLEKFALFSVWIGLGKQFQCALSLNPAFQDFCYWGNPDINTMELEGE